MSIYLSIVLLFLYMYVDALPSVLLLLLTKAFSPRNQTGRLRALFCLQPIQPHRYATPVQVCLQFCNLHVTKVE